MAKSTIDKAEYKFEAKIWLYQGNGPWHFVSVPTEVSATVSDRHTLSKRGWGSIPVEVTIKKTSWKTSIFPDSKTKTYLLPIKAEVRKKEALAAGDLAKITLVIKD